MSNDKILSVDEIRATLKKMKAGVKKQPGLMKSTYRYLDAVSGYVERIANAKEEGAWVASHGTQQPLEILEAMDVRGVFNEFWASSPTSHGWSRSRGHERVGLARTPGEVCSFFRNMDGLMHVGKWPRSDMFLYAASVCDNVKAFHTLGRRYGIPSFGLERSFLPYTAHAIEFWKNEYKRLIAFLEEQTGKKMDYDRLKDVVAKSYRLTELHLEIDKLVASVPCPLSRNASRRLSWPFAAGRARSTASTFSRRCATNCRSAWTRASAPSRTSASGCCGAPSHRSSTRP